MKTMQYQCILINDSGAVEFKDKFLDNAKPSVNELLRNAEKDFLAEAPVLEFEMYDDPEFNQVNDILHAPEDFIINERTKNIFESFKLPDHKFGRAKVTRVDKALLFLKTRTTLHYNWLYFNTNYWDQLYTHIDFDQSEIEVYEDKTLVNIQITSLDDIYNLRKSKRYLKLISKKIVLNNFDSSIDIFKLPLFSWMTYVSHGLRDKLLEERITDIKFVDTGVKSRLKAVQNPVIQIK
jgi:hypothetical protein